jgi:hypothetical protein
VLDQSVRSLRAGKAILENRVQVKSIGKGGTAPVPQKGSFIVSQTPNSLTQTPVLGGPVEINETDQNGQNIPFFDVSRSHFCPGRIGKRRRKLFFLTEYCSEVNKKTFILACEPGSNFIGFFSPFNQVAATRLMLTTEDISATSSGDT